MKTLSKIGLIAALTALHFAAASCSDKPKPPEAKEPPTVKEITDKYVDTMVTSPQKARVAAQAANEQTKASEKIIKDMDK